MGQKVNPVGFRLGVNRGWDSVWYAKKKDFGNYLIEDYRIREFIKKNISTENPNLTVENGFPVGILEMLEFCKQAAASLPASVDGVKLWLNGNILDFSLGVPQPPEVLANQNDYYTTEQMMNPKNYFIPLKEYIYIIYNGKGY